MHNSKLKRISLAVCFALMPMAAGAAGLGKLTVISGLGQPLNAEIELLSTSQEELASLSAQIATADVFADQGIERASAMSAIIVDIGKRPDGTPIISLKTAQPVNDPFLDMLIQVEWASGRLMREYTALLDPPGYGEQSSVTTTSSSPVVASTASAAMPGAPSEKVTGKSKKRKSGTASDASSDMPKEDVATDGYTTQKGDTLHAIASQNQVEGVSLEQMLVGLYRANEGAFTGKNMNRLKVGQIVHVPTQEELQSITQKEAVSEVHVQTADWNAYRNKLAGMVAESAPAMEEASPQAAGGKITAPAEDKSLPPAPGPRDVVKLSKSEAAASKAGGADVAGRLSALQEEATAREKAVKESSERVASLEKQLQDMQKLIEIKNKSLADAQKGAKTPEPAPATPPAKPVEPSKPVVPPAPVEPPKPPVPVAEPPTAVPAPQPPVAEKVEAPAPEAKPQPKKPKKIVRPAPPPAKEEPGLVDGLLGNPLLLAGAGGLLALIGGVWFFMRNKRRKGLDSFEQGILTSGGLKPNTVFGNTAGGTVDTGNTSFLTDFGQGASSAMIDTNEVDPIAEAEVYMAYGRDAQAEEILKDAIAKEPKRHELHLKLLEIFLGRKDVSAFETVAGELYASLGANDPTWRKVAELGRKLEPDNPLYGESGALPKDESAPAPVDFDATMIQQPAAAESELGSLDLGSTETTLDFSLDEPATPAASVAEEESMALDFDIGGLEMPGEVKAEEPVSESIQELESSILDLDVPLAPAATSEEMSLDINAPEAEEASPSLDMDLGMGLDLELPEPAAAESAQLDVEDIGLDALPDMLEIPAEAALEVSATPESASGTDISLDMPDLDISLDAEPVEDLSATAEPVDMGLELPSLDDSSEKSVEVEQPVAIEEVSLDIPEELSIPDEKPSVMEVSEAPADATGGLDFNFDADLGESEAEVSAPATPVASPLADLDLSGISLDIDDLSPTSTNNATEEISMSISDESADVDTKLDLVTAYIDMGDQEGARELLQEVLKEGGPAQREKAQKLLDGLG